MAKKPQHVTEAELAVLEVLWDAEPATIRTITDRLYPGGGASVYATVQKLLERLEAKGCVRRSRRTVPHEFRARVDRSKLITDRLRDVADTLCGGSMTPLLTQLLGSADLTKDDVRSLRDLVDRLDDTTEGKAAAAKGHEGTTKESDR